MAGVGQHYAGDDYIVQRYNRSDNTHAYRFWITVNETDYNPSTNTSSVTYTFWFDNNTSYNDYFWSGYSSGQPTVKYYINGTERASGYVRSEASAYNPAAGKNYQIGSAWSTTHTHASDGTLSVTGGVAVTAATAGGYCTNYGPKTSSNTTFWTMSTAGGHYTLPKVVYYNANGGGSTPATQYSAGSAITLAAAISKSSSVSTTNFNISYNANGGNSTPSTQTGTKTVTTPYSFNGWHENSATGTSHSASSSFTPSANVTMYAGWNTGTASTTYKSITLPAAITHGNTSANTTITTKFNVNGGSSATPSDLTSTKTVTTSYSFNGWHEGSATGTNHAASSTWSPTAAKTLYAGWDTSTASTTYTSITLPAAPTRTGYTFKGWYNASSGGTKRGNAGASYSPTTSETLYAQWNGVTSTVTFNGNGASTNTFAQQTYTYGASGQSFVGTIARQGYTMLGWSHSSTATTQTYSTNSGVSNDWINGHQGAQVLYAVWKANTYTLTFNANGGTVSSSTKSVTYGMSYTDLPLPTRPGYIFRGWFANCVNSAGSAVNFGRAYKYVSSMSVHFITYSTDYSGWGNYRIISCTEGGGWNIENGSSCPRLAVYDETAAGYKTQNFSITWANITPGFHQWDIVLNNKVVTAYLDGTARATITMSGANIKYHATNAIFVGAEAAGTDTAPTSPYLNGYVGNIVLSNSTTRITNLGRQRFTAPAQNVTLYALWEPYFNVYIKGKTSGWVLLKNGYNWQN